MLRERVWRHKRLGSQSSRTTDHQVKGDFMFSFLRRDCRIQPLDDASMNQPIYRHISHGPILPMEQPGLLERLFSRR